MVLCNLYLKRCDLTNVLLFELSQLLFGTNCVVVMTQYWSWNHFYHQFIGGENDRIRNFKSNASRFTKFLYEKNARQTRSFYETKCAAGKVY